MAVSYNGLWKLLIDKNMNKVEMMKLVGISSSTVAKMTNSELVSMKVLEKSARSQIVILEILSIMKKK